MTKRLNIAFGVGIICLLSSCVPQRQFLDLKSSYDALKSEYADLREATKEHTQVVDGLRIEITERESTIGTLEQQLAELNSNLKNMETGTIENEEELRKQLEVSIKDREALSFELENKRQELYKREQELLEKTKLLEGRQAANATRSEELDALKAEIEQKEKAFEEQQKIVQGQSGDINQLTADLAKREVRLKELESIIGTQQDQVKTLQNTISSALTDFSAGDLSVTEKDGKVYVSLQSKLLFKSGSKTVEPRGRDALGKVASILRGNPDIDIIIEGHTDDVGETASNWDLSVLRATSVVKLLVDTHGVNPNRVVASGRGEHNPVASNSDSAGKQQNRRIEIILSPKLDQLYNVINR